MNNKEIKDICLSLMRSQDSHEVVNILKKMIYGKTNQNGETMEIKKAVGEL